MLRSSARSASALSRHRRPSSHIPFGNSGSESEVGATAGAITSSSRATLPPYPPLTSFAEESEGQYRAHTVRGNHGVSNLLLSRQLRTIGALRDIFAKNHCAIVAAEAEQTCKFSRDKRRSDDEVDTAFGATFRTALSMKAHRALSTYNFSLSRTRACVAPSSGGRRIAARRTMFSAAEAAAIQPHKTNQEAAQVSDSQLSALSSSSATSASLASHSPQPASAQGATARAADPVFLFLMLVTNELPHRVSRSRSRVTSKKIEPITVERKARARMLDVSPGDESIAAAQRAYSRERARKSRLAAAGASAETLREAEATVKRTLEVFKLRCADPANVEERERMAAKRRAKRNTKHDRLADDGSIRWAYKMYQRDLGTRRRQNHVASGQMRAKLEAAVQERKMLLQQRLNDPGNAEELKGLPKFLQAKRRLLRSEDEVKRIIDIKNGQAYQLWHGTGNDDSVEEARRLRFRAFAQLSKARRADASAEVVASLQAAYRNFKKIFDERLLAERKAEDQRRGTSLAADDSSIAAANRAYKRELARRRKLLRDKASAEQLALADVVVQQSLEVLRSRRADPINAGEWQDSLERKRCASARKDDGSLRAAYNMRKNAKRRLLVARNREASAETIAQLEAEYEASKELHSERLASTSGAEAQLPRVARNAPDDGSVKSALRIRQREEARRRRREPFAAEEERAELDSAVRRSRQTWIERLREVTLAELQTGQAVPPRQPEPERRGPVAAPDDGSIHAARKSCRNILSRLRRARQSGATSEKVVGLEQELRAQKTVLAMRYYDPRQADEAAAIVVRRRKPNEPRNSTPKPDSIAAAQRMYWRDKALQAKLRRVGASEERLAEVDVALKQSLLAYQRSRADPANAEERQRQLAEQRASRAVRASGATKGPPAPAPDDGSIAAAQRAYKRAQAVTYRLRLFASRTDHEKLAQANLDVQKKLTVLQARRADPANAEEHSAMRVARRTSPRKQHSSRA